MPEPTLKKSPNLIRHASVAALFAACLALQACGGGGGGGNGGGTNGNGGNNGGSSGTVVTDNPQKTVALDYQNGQSNLTQGVSLRVNDSGTTVTQIPVEIQSAYVGSFTVSGVQESGVDAMTCKTLNGRFIYEGDSGAPVLIKNANTGDEEIAGGLFASDPNDNTHQVFFARGIGQMEATQSGTPVAPGLAAPRARVIPQWFFEGSPGVLDLLRQKAPFSNTRYEGPQPSARKAPLLPGNSVAPIPGLRFACPFVIGPDVVAYDMATYTLQMSNGQWVATGHGIEDAGTVSWPIASVSVDDLNTQTNPYQVDSHIIGGIYGTMVWDGQNGSVIDATKAAAMMPVTVSTTLNGLPQLPVTHQVKFDMGSTTENTGIELAAQGTIDSQETNVNGPYNASGSITMNVGGSNVTKNLSFPNGENLSDLETKLGTDIDAILTAQQTAHPTQQIQSISISLSVTG